MRSYDWPILLFCGAIFLSPVNDAIVKLVTVELSIAEVICIRALFCACILLCIKNNVRELTRTEIDTLLLLVCRATLLSMSMFLYIYSLRFLPLSIAVSIFYLAPVFISLLSPVFLREPMRLNNIIFVLIGFFGVLLISEPWSADPKVEVLLVVIAALSYAFFQLLTRATSSKAGTLTVVTVQHLALSIISGIVILYNFSVTHHGSDFSRIIKNYSFENLMLIFICGLIVLCFSFASANAYRKTYAFKIAPLEFVAIPSGVIWSYIIWNYVPSMSAIGGIFVIFMVGLINSRLN